MKAFPKQEQKVLTVTIDENGDLLYLKTSEHDIFAEMGEVVTKERPTWNRATFWLRVAFHILRTSFSDKSRIAEWTRGWSCSWRVNTAPVGGPILRGLMSDWNCCDKPAGHYATGPTDRRQSTLR